ncbi:DUF1156 domain-containing protein [Deltaproteobacteria bacterium TL4]
MTQKKKLIEVALPLEAINTASAREKSIRHGHPSTLHLWWARRPLATCRAVLFASLVDDPSSLPDQFPTEEAQNVERQRLFRLIEELVLWENSNNEDVLKRARKEILKSTDGNPPPVLDPFCGGGSIPLEAQRLGLEAHGSDLNPVAVLITKALIEIPPKFAGQAPVNPDSRKQMGHGGSWHGATGLAEDIRYYGQWMRDEAFKRIGHLYPKVQLPEDQGGGEATVIAWLWARTVASPNPAAKGNHVPLVRSFSLSTKKGKEAWVEPILDHQSMTYRFEVRSGTGKPREGVIGRKGGTCLLTESPMPFDYIRKEGKAGRVKEKLMAIVAEGKSGRVYLSPTEEHEQLASKANPTWIPEHDLPHNPRDFKTPNYGMTSFADLFTPRQLVALTTFSDLVGEAREKVKEDYLGAQASRLQKKADETSALPGSSSKVRSRKAWHSRGYLPHFEAGEQPQSITFRLRDSLPQSLLQQWQHELQHLSEEDRQQERRHRIEESLDQGIGECWLKRPEIAEILQNALLHFDGIRYQLHRWCIMPNHVHVLITPLHQNSLSGIVHSWKSYTAKEANRLLHRQGAFWQEEYFDRMIRNQEHWNRTCEYIEYNPVKAGLVSEPQEWKWSSTREEKMQAGRLRSQGHSSQDEIPLSEGGTGATAYADAVATYLGFAVDKGSDYWSAVCSWNSGRDTIRNTFGRQAIPMVWDYAEGNPFSDSTGNFSSCIDWIWKVVQQSPAGVQGMVHQKDAATGWKNLGAQASRLQEKADETSALPENAPLISTDPPYYDNIGYADLSDFFYVWLRRSLNKVHPQLFSTMLVPKAPELVATPYRFGGNKNKARQFFEEGLGQVFQRARESAHPEFPLTVYYAFKQTEESESDLSGSEGVSPSGRAGRSPSDSSASTGWETMLEGLIQAGFAIVGTWPMRTERSARSVSIGTNALASSIVLVCRPRLETAPMIDRREFIAQLKQEMPKALIQLQLGNIAPVDLAQASIGPGMAIYSRYRKVVEADGSRMSVRTALQLINQMMDEFLTEQEGEYEADTRWALSWYEQYAFKEGPYGEAEVLSKAKNTSVSGVVEAGILESRTGKVRLLKRNELLKDWLPETDKRLTVWEGVQYLIRELEQRGESGAAELFSHYDASLKETTRELAYRLYNLCERKGWAQEALAYNTLIVSWPEMEKLARDVKHTAPVQEDLFGRSE